MAPGIHILSPEQVSTLDKKSTQGNDIPLLSDASTAQLDDLHEKGSRLVVTAAEWLDSFFDDPRSLSEENRTRAKIKLALGYTKFDEFEIEPSVDLRLQLPRLEKKANVFLRLNDDSDFDADASPIANTQGGNKLDDESLTAGVQYFLAMGEQYNVSTELGASLDYLYAGLRYRYLDKVFNDRWDGRFTNRLRYYTDDGWEDKMSYDIETYFGERFFYRTTFTALFSEAEEGVPFSGLARLYQVFDIDSAVLYDAGIFFDTEPSLVTTDIQFRVRYRQRFYRDWLVLEIAPQVTFPRDYDYQTNPGLVARFEFDFGYLQDREAYQSVFRF